MGILETVFYKDYLLKASYKATHTIANTDCEFVLKCFQGIKVKTIEQSIIIIN